MCSSHSVVDAERLEPVGLCPVDVLPLSVALWRLVSPTGPRSCFDWVTHATPLSLLPVNRSPDVARRGRRTSSMPNVEFSRRR